MSCREIKSSLPLFLAGELPQDEKSRIKIHLEKCLNCKKELELFQKSWDLLDIADKIQPSIAFKSKVRRKISENGYDCQKNKFLRMPEFLPKWVPAAVIMFLLMTGGGGLYLRKIFINQRIQNYALIFEYENTRIPDDLDLAEELELIENMHVLEEVELIDSINL
ncbi:MAG: zf-HC2 domain-containing protein [bacterium]